MADTGPLLLDAPCWILADSHGPWDERHWPTREKVLADVRDANDPDYNREDEVIRGALPCRVAIAACGYVFDQEGEGVQHLDADLAEAEEWLYGAQWVRLPDGQWACGDDRCQCVALLGDAAKPSAVPVSTGPAWTNDRLEGIDV